jgi:alpha-ketoglutarate-dependent taurine dioxygenase
LFDDPEPIAVTVDSDVVGYDVIEGATPIRLIVPAAPDVDLLSWAAANTEAIQRELAEFGALLFRGFGIDQIDRLRDFARVFSDQLLPYVERRSPRTELGERIYTSTIHPADQYIHFHNTTSFSHQWPRTIWFACLQPSESGGRTPIADCRKALADLDPEIRRRFEEQGVAYVSNYYDGMGLTWQTTFQTTDRDDVERYCSEHGIEWEWLGGERLRTRSRRHAVIEHPHTGQLSWFNQAHHFHVRSLEPDTSSSLLSTFAEEDLPRNSYYGDGSEIEPDTLEHLYACYRDNENSFDWQRGDVLMLENMTVAHSRTPYRGERLIALALADMYRVERREGGRAYASPSASTFVEGD